MQANVADFCITIAAGLGCTAKRLCPGLELNDIPKVLERMSAPSFCQTKHGAANYRYDRGVLPGFYADTLDLMFGVMLVRCCMNDAELAAAFFRSWVPTYKDWDENRAARLLASVWRAGQHDMGMGLAPLSSHGPSTHDTCGEQVGIRFRGAKDINWMFGACARHSGDRKGIC